jgi:hypothetical protein
MGRKADNALIRRPAVAGILIKEIARRTGDGRKVVRNVVRGGRADVFRVRASSLEPYLMIAPPAKEPNDDPISWMNFRGNINEVLLFFCGSHLVAVLHHESSSRFCREHRDFRNLLLRCRCHIRSFPPFSAGSASPEPPRLPSTSCGPHGPTSDAEASAIPGGTH